MSYYNPDLPLIVACYASSVGLGAFLAHKLANGGEKPIAYASRTLSNIERYYSQIYKESLAIIFCCEALPYLSIWKRPLHYFHRPQTLNISLFGANSKLPTLVAARLQRWALNLSAYNYEIKYRTGANNGNADALSRKPLVQNNVNAQEDKTNNVLAIETIPFNVSNDVMVRETRKDRILSVVYDCFLKGRELPQAAEFLPHAKVKDQLKIDKECVLKAIRVIVPVK